MTRPPRITAMVSTYAAERFLRGCLEDLLAQTMADELEILVIDAASPQNERAIVEEFAARFPRLRYVRTATRVNTSEAFNLATEMATGRYLTTANTDDRHHPEFCARMCDVLDRHPDIALAYADTRITTVENETWADNTATLRHAWPDYTPTAALSCCLFGAQAVWRRDVHERVGSWDPTILRANDQDMFLRIALAEGAIHVREDLGLFLRREDSESGRANHEATLSEVLTVMRRHREDTPLRRIFPALARPEFASDQLAEAAAWFELGLLAALGPYTDAEFAIRCFERGHRAGGENVRYAFANNLGAVLACAGSPVPAARALQLAVSAGGDGAGEAVDNLARLRAVKTPRLREMSFAAVDHPVVADSRRGLGIGADRICVTREMVPWDVFEGPNGVPIGRDIVLVMYGWSDRGGGTILPRAFAAELAAQGRARGDRVAVIYAAATTAPELAPYGVRRTVENGVRVFGIHNRATAFMAADDPASEIDDQRAAMVFAELLDELEPDVVHFWNLHGLGMSLPRACRQRGIPTVLSSNNYWSVCPRLYLVSERLARCDGASADGAKCARCLGGSAPAADYGDRRAAGVRMLRQDIDVHLATSNRVRELHIRNGDDPRHVRVLRQEPPAVADIWRRSGAGRPIVECLTRPLRIGYIGSVMAHKGVHVLAAALQRLPAERLEAVAIGDVAPGYLDTLRQFDPAGRLQLAGAYDPSALPELLAQLDVVVVPSVWDDCAPFVVAEALAARCPVIGADIGGIPDFVEPGENGLLVPAGDAPALAAAVATFLRDPEQLGRMQRAIAPPRGLPAFTRDVVDVYDELLAGATQRRCEHAGREQDRDARGDEGREQPVGITAPGVVQPT